MEDVRELVRDDERKPVLVEAQRVALDGRRREHDDAIVRQRRGVSVRVVGIVGDDEIDCASWRLQLLRQLYIRTLGRSSRDASLELEANRDVNVKVLGVERAVALVRRGLRVGCDCGCEQQQRREQGMLHRVASERK